VDRENASARLVARRRVRISHPPIKYCRFHDAQCVEREDQVKGPETNLIDEAIIKFIPLRWAQLYFVKSVARGDIPHFFQAGKIGNDREGRVNDQCPVLPEKGDLVFDL
jgi:hypothetical protein